MESCIKLFFTGAKIEELKTKLLTTGEVAYDVNKHEIVNIEVPVRPLYTEEVGLHYALHNLLRQLLTVFLKMHKAFQHPDTFFYIFTRDGKLFIHVVEIIES